MFIKLTRLDNSPIWINAAFVVTVEPRKGGGSVVVLIGDGLDYDVRETTDQVLALLGGAPVPLENGKASDDAGKAAGAAENPLARTAGALPLSSDEIALPVEKPADEPKPAKRTRRTKKATAEKTEDETAAKPAKRPRRTKKAVVEEAAAEVAPVEEKPVEVKLEEAPVAKPVVDLSDEQIARLKKMMPRSMRKLWNTLVTQFKVALKDAESVIDLLQARDIIEVEREHVIWK